MLTETFRPNMKREKQPPDRPTTHGHAGPIQEHDHELRCTCDFRRDVQLHTSHITNPSSQHKIFLTTGQSTCANAWRYFTWSSTSNRRKIRFSFILLLLMTYILHVASICKVEHCSTRYTNSIDSTGTEHGSSPEYCSILLNYNTCLKDTARGCRGQLKYHTTSALVRRWIRDKKCNSFQSSPSLPSLSTPDESDQWTFSPDTDDTMPEWLDPSSESRCHAKLFRATPDQMKYCVMFGDPHVKTFSNELHTCRVKGAWPLINNDHLEIMVTSEPIADDSLATVIKEITIKILGPKPCSYHQTYIAQSSSPLPSSFTSGSSGTSPGISINERQIGRHVVLRLDFLSTTITIRNIRGGLLSIAVHMPESLARTTPDDRLDLCTRSCPSSQRVDVKAVISDPIRYMEEVTGGHRVTVATPRDVALDTCRRGEELRGDFLDACVFDLLMTGEVKYRRPAATAQKDFLRSQAGASKVVGNRTTLNLGYSRQEEYVGSGSRRDAVTTHIIISIIITTTVWTHIFSSSTPT